MQFSAKTGAPEKQATGCIVAGVFEGRKFSESAKSLDKGSRGYLHDIVRKSGLEGRTGQLLMLYRVPGVKAASVLLVGCGKRSEFTLRTYRKACKSAACALLEHAVVDAASSLALADSGIGDVYQRVRHSVEATQEAIYRFTQCKSTREESPVKLKRLDILLEGRGQTEAGHKAIREGSAIAAGVALARDLGNLPGNICTPSYLANQARGLGRKYKQLKITVMEEAGMKQLGMGALLAVSRGSRQPAKLIVMAYQGAPKAHKPYVLVGKGITFDAGGISLKPPPTMDEMKFDMCGAASVFGAIRAVVELALPINVIGVVPSAENLPDGNADKPGDIVTSMSGQTIEILNTDAEGRLVLCDALTYSERFKPETVIDIATLTGACVIALGGHASGLFGNDEPLVKELLAAGEEADDRAWQLPLWDDYQEQLKSNFADFANVGGREAGSITAACFLARFTKKMRWAHLDVAGTAWKTGNEKGATGRPVSLLVQYLLHRKR